MRTEAPILANLPIVSRAVEAPLFQIVVELGYSLVTIFMCRSSVAEPRGQRPISSIPVGRTLGGNVGRLMQGACNGIRRAFDREGIHRENEPCRQRRNGIISR